MYLNYEVISLESKYSVLVYMQQPGSVHGSQEI
jgi:hypothetical protein